MAPTQARSQGPGPLLFARAASQGMQLRPGTGSAIIPRPGTLERPLRSPAPTRQFRGEQCGEHHPKTDVVVTVVGMHVVTIGAAHVPVVVVERAATQHTAPVSLPPHQPVSRDRKVPGRSVSASYFGKTTHLKLSSNRPVAVRSRSPSLRHGGTVLEIANPI